MLVERKESEPRPGDRTRRPPQSPWPSGGRARPPSPRSNVGGDRPRRRGEDPWRVAAAGGSYQFDDLVAELLQDDDDPGGRVVVLGGGPDEADGVERLGDEGRELRRDGGLCRDISALPSPRL